MNWISLPDNEMINVPDLGSILMSDRLKYPLLIRSRSRLSAKDTVDRLKI